MRAWRARLAVLLSAALPAASAAPAWAAERAVPVVATDLPAAGVSARLPALPASSLALGAVPALGVSIPSSIIQAPAVAAAPAVAPPQAQAASLAGARQQTVSGHSLLPAQAGVSSGVDAGRPSLYARLRATVVGEKGADAPGAALFDGAAKRDAAATPVKAAALGVLAPAVVLGARHLALGAGFATLNYTVANGLSMIFPLPEIHRAFSRGHAVDFPLWRAILGAVGASAVGLMNATVLDKPLWGTMYLFVSLGLLAPYFIGRYLKKRGVNFAAPAPREGSKLARLYARIKSDRALHRTLLTGAALLAVSAGFYYGAAAVIPPLLAATFAQASVDRILFAVQVLKGLLFAVVFAPDAVDMFRGRKPHGFSPWLDLLFVLSTSAFVAWGVQAALASPPGMIRRQYLVHAARNLLEAIAASVSFVSLRRAARVSHPSGNK